jgi:murein tripeptide amidase MpaA
MKKMKVNYNLTPYFNRHSVEWYQEKCRIYLDEYPEQEKLRNLYFMNKMFPFKLPNIEWE